jgi:threonine-phosphate decarboxylase
MSCSHGGIYSVDPRLVKVDFSSNVNPLGISITVVNSIQKNARSLSSVYPDPHCLELKRNLCDYLDNRLDLDLDWITIGNGSTEIIHNFARAFIRDKVVIPAPTFCEYELASRRMGANILYAPLKKDLSMDVELIIEKAKNVDAVFICNPNNPTGLVSSKSIKKIIENVDGSTKILIDESFIELVDEGTDHFSLISKVKEFDNLIILRSLTKSFGLAGLRVGYSVCNAKLSKKLSVNQISWNVNGIAQMAGIVALKDIKHLVKARLMIKKERKFLHDRIRKQMRDLIPCKSFVNYFLIYLKNGKSSVKIRNDILRRSGVLVRDCSTFTGMGEKYIRVSVKTHDQNVILLKALELIDK